MGCQLVSLPVNLAAVLQIIGVYRATSAMANLFERQELIETSCPESQDP
jgi:hypothetical protein